MSINSFNNSGLSCYNVTHENTGACFELTAVEKVVFVALVETVVVNNITHEMQEV